MSATCCSNTPPGTSAEEKARRDRAIEILAKAIDEAAALGYAVHTAYNTKYFFIERVSP
jgi:sugar phosphate isomerase/epimerase